MYQRILVPVDGSSTSGRGLTEALKLAKLTGASLRLLHVVDELYAAVSMPGFGEANIDVLEMLKEGGHKVLQAAQQQAQAEQVAAEAVLLESYSGRLHEHVAAQAKEWGADIVVLGSHGRRGVGRMVLGSDAEQIIRNSEIPVLVVREAAAAAT